MWDATFSLMITPSLNQEMVAVLWMYSTQVGEMLPMLVVGWRASALRGKEAGRFRKAGRFHKARRFHEVAGVSIVAAGNLISTVESRVA